MEFNAFINGISSGALDKQFCKLYGNSERAVLRQRARYMSAAEGFSRLYPESTDIHIYTAPGRTEISGNHTDHQHGCVLAAAVSADILAIVSYTDENIIRISSGDYPDIAVELDDTAMRSDEAGTSAALVRGIASGFRSRGVQTGGFNAYLSSDIIIGGGLSSSAAFEILIADILNGQSGRNLSPEEVDAVCKNSENEYFGKSCGIMDQLVSSVGGAVFLDLAAPDAPLIERIDLDLRSAGYSICITYTGGSHAGLNEEYSAVSLEMSHVAELLGCEVLREADENDFYSRLPELRKVCSDRELLRAAHFFDENRRASLEAEALRNGDTEGFFALVNESGRSSEVLLQNLYPASSPETQPLSLALMLTRRFLSGTGASRVHGGGFAGTIQAFVPTYMTSGYIKEMERIFGEGCCSVVNVRPVGGHEITL